MEENPAIEYELEGVEDVEFTRQAASQLYHSGEARTIAEERWNRARNDIRFDDVVQELTGKWGRAISCPFHGTDSRPSFYLFPQNNDGFCFGCPPREQYYDNVRFVSKSLNISRVKALSWLERKFDLPPIADVIQERIDEDEEIVKLEFADVSEHFIRFAARDIQSIGDPELAKEYLRIYYEAERDDSRDKNFVPMTIARVLGREAIKAILQRKAYK